MDRVLAWLLVPALIAVPGVAPSLHIHAYDDHDHPEHHHGWSAHAHHAVRRSGGEGTAHLEGCDPGRHTVSYAFVCAGPPQVHAADAELTGPAAPSPERQMARTVCRHDVRAHGPPPRPRSSPRAPPLIALA